MGVLVIDWQTYYEAGKKCHALATDLRAADKPVHDAVKGDCAGMAGDTAGCESWGKTYDRVAQETMQACTNLADALTNFGTMLYAAGYNWALSNNSNPMPDRPTVTAMSEYKVSIPTSVGNNGDGVTEGKGSIPGFYDALVGKIQEEFGSKLPNGNKDKLAKAASTWKTFAERTTIKGAAGRITEISNLFSDIQDKKGLDPLLGHLTTLNGGATQLASASLSLATPVAEYSTATSETRDKFRDAVTNALIAAGTTVVIGVAASWITAALSDVAAGVGVVAIAGNTARVLKSTYDASKLIKIIGTASAVAGAAAFTVTAFDKVPSLTDIAIKLGAIIAMKVLIDDDVPDAPGNDGGTTSAAGPKSASDVESVVNSRTQPGKTEPHRQMATDDEIRQLYNELTKNGEPMDVGTYPGKGSRLPDGTEIRIRDGSKSGGVTLDIKYPGNPTPVKVHLPK
ncbi:hypothetical protein ACIBJI_26675 [Nocardia sp. NPDC050408]|uniref:hypothetical protein n=1 Tax=Nocardia sp. NPDC050408 TaxID=3364319 RepID=UPI00379AAFBD